MFRILGTPIVALCGVVAAGIVIRATGAQTYGLVTLVSTIGLLLPFADLGIAAVAMNAVSTTRTPSTDLHVVDTVRAAFRSLVVVAVVITIAALAVMAADGWDVLIGLRSGDQDRWAITAGVIVFAWTIPAGIGLRLLIGADKNELAVLATMSNSVLGLMITVLLYAVGVRGIWFVLPALLGILLGNLASTVVALRITGIGRLMFGPVPSGVSIRTMLAGSLWLFFVSVGIPFGIQVQRMFLSHLSTPQQLSQYALMAQVFGIGWGVLSTAALSLWPVFIKRRADHTSVIALWVRTTGAFCGIAVVGAAVLAVLGPWVCSLISGGSIRVTTGLALAFGALLIVQATHLPSGVLLTNPSGARWQTWCLGAMVVVTVVGCIAVAPRFGAVGVVTVTACAVALCQVVPDLTSVPRLVRRRSAAEAESGAEAVHAG
ncbi:lipopolysaccharide biosynthesis protein [Williamsia deligens]|uniref:Lipopolysaccharide biosynthesis protein n=1 Tax=Williamsia deligens TaxID=321325 RepID=A0ABW3G551_9NOCA|nr:oligosaccharide flippase family protein [Williamsia deligens]MCP2194515.1 Membrane protein involved in the export of O-antigen and teichoic acid [Williamsia deligens]